MKIKKTTSLLIILIVFCNGNSLSHERIDADILDNGISDGMFYDNLFNYDYHDDIVYIFATLPPHFFENVSGFEYYFSDDFKKRLQIDEKNKTVHLAGDGGQSAINMQVVKNTEDTISVRLVVSDSEYTSKYTLVRTTKYSKTHGWIVTSEITEPYQQ